MEQQQRASVQTNVQTRDSLSLRMPVFSSDGFHLGHIQQMDPENRQFKINSPGKFDYWLDESTIMSVRAGYVLLSLTRSDAEHRGRMSQDRSLPFISPNRDPGPDMDPENERAAQHS